MPTIRPTLGPFGVNMWGMPKTAILVGETCGNTSNSILRAHVTFFMCRTATLIPTLLAQQLGEHFMVGFGGVLAASFGYMGPKLAPFWLTFCCILPLTFVHSYKTYLSTNSLQPAFNAFTYLQSFPFQQYSAVHSQCHSRGL